MTPGATVVGLQHEFHGAPLAFAAPLVDPLREEGGHHADVALVGDGGPQGVRPNQIAGIDVAEWNEGEN